MTPTEHAALRNELTAEVDWAVAEIDCLRHRVAELESQGEADSAVLEAADAVAAAVEALDRGERFSVTNYNSTVMALLKAAVARRGAVKETPQEPAQQGEPA